LVPSREQLLTGERVTTCRTSSIETSRKLQSSRPSWRTYDGGGGGSTHFFNLLDEKLGKFVGVMSVEDDTGLCHVTRLMKMTARARGHTIFKWPTIVTILHLFRDSPPPLTHRDLNRANFIPLQFLGPVRGDPRPNFVTAIIVVQKLE